MDYYDLLKIRNKLLESQGGIWGRRRPEPCTGEYLFELLDHFDEVPLPDGRWYRLEKGELQEKFELTWRRSEVSVNELISQVKHFTYDDWVDLQAVSKRSTYIDFTRFGEK